MKNELEITTKYLGTIDELHEELTSKNFEIIDTFRMYDIYMLPCDIDLNSYNNLELLSKCILIRQIDEKKKMLCYKHKEYDSNGNIINQGKINCKIDNINDAKEFMKAINYNELFAIDSSVKIYSNSTNEICVQIVDKQGIYIEYEQNNSRTNSSNGDTIDEMINSLNSFNLNIDKSNYFAKKAEDALIIIKSFNAVR